MNQVMILLICYLIKIVTLSVNTNFSFFLSYYLQGFIECLCTHLKKLSDIIKTCSEEIREWCHLQQRSLGGYPCPPPLDKLQEVYVHLYPVYMYSYSVVCNRLYIRCTKLLSVLFILLLIVVNYWQSYSGNYFNRLHRSVVRTILNPYYTFKNYYNLVRVVYFLCRWYN